MYKNAFVTVPTAHNLRLQESYQWSLWTLFLVDAVNLYILLIQTALFWKVYINFAYELLRDYKIYFLVYYISVNELLMTPWFIFSQLRTANSGLKNTDSTALITPFRVRSLQILPETESGVVKRSITDSKSSVGKSYMTETGVFLQAITKVSE